MIPLHFAVGSGPNLLLSLRCVVLQPVLDHSLLIAGIVVTLISACQAIFFWYQRTYHNSASWENVREGIVRTCAHQIVD